MLARAGHRLIYFKTQFELELVECSLDFVRLAAALVDGGDALLEIHAGLDSAEHFVACAEHTFEELELLGQKLEDALIGGIVAVEEIDNHHVVLLAVAVAATDALFDTLRVPGKIVVHDQGTELEVDALGPCLGGNHDAALFAEIINEG